VSKSKSLISTPSSRVVELATTASRARGYIDASRSSATLRAYRSDWTHFEAWCDEHNLVALPAEPAVVAMYLTDMADSGDFKASTLSRRLVSIAQAHKAAGHKSPTSDETVRLVNAGIRRTIGTAQRAVRPVVTEDIRAMVATCRDDPAGTRDRALLLVGFAAALRRSEVAALNVDDIEQTRDGLVVTLRRSKMDQEAAGRRVGVPYGSKPATCPVRAYGAWIEVAGLQEGAVFRPVDRHGNIGDARITDRGVALVVKRRAELAGMDPAEVSGHSLRGDGCSSCRGSGTRDRPDDRSQEHDGAEAVYPRGESVQRERGGGYRVVGESPPASTSRFSPTLCVAYDGIVSAEASLVVGAIGFTASLGVFVWSIRRRIGSVGWFWSGVAGLAFLGVAIQGLVRL
jgi:site-specific recombinase XerD